MTGSPKDDRNDLVEFYAQAASESPLLGVSTSAGRFLVDVRDQVVGRVLFVKHGRGEMTVLERAIAVLDDLGLGRWTTSGWFVDAGANIGTSTVAALTQHGFAGAVCIEPDVANRRLLDLNLMLNDVDDRARVVPAALSDRSGTAPLILDSKNFGNHRLGSPDDPTAGPRDEAPNVEVEVEVEVEVATIDGLIASGVIDPAMVGMFWLDIQGHEARALAGASDLLRQGVPIVFELYPSGLDALGGCASIVASVAEWYDRIVDLRVARGRPGAREALTYELLPLTALQSLADAYQDGVTDVLVVPRSK